MRFYGNEMMIKTDLCGLTADEIRIFTGSDNSYAVAIANNLYKKRINDILLFPGIPGQIKDKLNRITSPGIYGPLSSCKSSDGTIKFLFRNEIGQEFETVLLRERKEQQFVYHHSRAAGWDAISASPVNMVSEEIYQSRDILTQVLGLPDSENVTHVVFMGMGEPMDNLDNVLKACNILSAEWGLAISPRNITVSTVGITPGDYQDFLKNQTVTLLLVFIHLFLTNGTGWSC